MTDDPENLVLVFLRRMDAKLDQIAEIQRDHGRRLTTLDVAVANLAATEASHYANGALRADRTDERLARIERRLELAEA